MSRTLLRFRANRREGRAVNNTRYLMIFSAAWLLILALAVSFAGVELLEAMGMAVTPAATPLLKLLGAALLGFAMMNWMAKGTMIGGIYARPLAAGNFLYFAIATLSLVKPLFGGGLPLAMIVAMVIHAVFAAPDAVKNSRALRTAGRPVRLR
jgi:hypothetical protein